jgi:hypothetical protein
MKDREELYRDTFINEQVGLGSGFPRPPELIRKGEVDTHDSSSTCLTIAGGEHPI